MDEREAREKYDSGEEFTAAVHAFEGNGHPTLVTCAWKNEYASVAFLDPFGREEVKYIFHRENDSWLFLNRIIFRKYPNDNPRLRISEAIRFEDIEIHKDGYMKRVIIDKQNNTKETIEYSDVPVEPNWEPIPEFGSWLSISRYERQ
jgi:hypothetical protein